VKGKCKHQQRRGVGGGGGREELLRACGLDSRHQPFSRGNRKGERQRAGKRGDSAKISNKKRRISVYGKKKKALSNQKKEGEGGRIDRWTKQADLASELEEWVSKRKKKKIECRKGSAIRGK